MNKDYAIFSATMVAIISITTGAFAQTGTAAPASAGPCVTKFTDPVPKGNPGNWITGADYPAVALRNGDQGRVVVRFYVTAEGRIESAEVVESNATPALDDATIRYVTRRGRFIPATRNCIPVPGEYSAPFKWILPAD